MSIHGVLGRVPATQKLISQIPYMQSHAQWAATKLIGKMISYRLG